MRFEVGAWSACLIEYIYTNIQTQMFGGSYARHTSYAMLLSGMYRGIYAKKIQVTSGDILWYTTRKPCITILYHVIENTWHYIINAVHDGTVGCDTVELH